jgi:hypothetical protein
VPELLYQPVQQEAEGGGKSIGENDDNTGQLKHFLPYGKQYNGK